MIPQIIGGALLLISVASHLGVSAPNKETFSENARENGKARAVVDELSRMKAEAEKGIQREHAQFKKEQEKK